MSDVASPFQTVFREAFAAEAAADFPLLGRIPQVKAIQFVDYFRTLASPDREALLDALAARAAAAQTPTLGGRPALPAFDRFWQAATSPGPFTGGVRYCDVKALATVPKLPQFGGFDGWLKSCGFTGMALVPREDLLPGGDRALLVPAKAPLLKKLVDAMLRTAGFTKAKPAPAGGEVVYFDPSGLELRLDFGSRTMGQLRYRAAPPPAAERRFAGGSLEETFWSLPGGWDYLTEENAPRLVALLPAAVARVAALAERLRAAA